MTLNGRVAWVLGLVKDREKLNNVQLGQKLGVNKNTAGVYAQGKGDLKGCALAGIVEHFNINGEWLISGRGEPFPGACNKFPEVCGAPGITKEQQDAVTSYVKAHILTPEGIKDTGAGHSAPDALFSSDQKINIEEAMGKTYKVLSAGSSLSVALYMNIQQFAVALDTSLELREYKNQISSMQQQIDELKRQVDRFTAAPATSVGQDNSLVKKAM